ncbi:Adenylate kinase 9, partial [Bulinus truncatus]
MNKDYLEIDQRMDTFVSRSTHRRTVSMDLERDTWYDVPDPNKKAVSIMDECADSVKAVTLIAQNIDGDPYIEDEAELRFLFSKPLCFIVLGKPGSGKTKLAKKLAQEWNCELINSTDIIQQNMDLQTEIGKKSRELLLQGQAVTDEMVLKMIIDKVNSPEVAHHGYVLDDLPCISEELMSVRDQIEMIKNWKLTPDFIINIRIPDKDIETRRMGQKLDPQNGEIYPKEIYAPEKKVITEHVKENLNEEEEAEEEELGEEEELVDNIELAVEVLQRLVRRPEDMPEYVADNINKYRNNMLKILEEYMADHDQQYLVELDGNESPLNIFKQLMQKLQTFAFRPAAVVRRIWDSEEEDMPEDIEAEELMRTLTSKQMVAPRYRWRRSKWMNYCPVALWEGNILSGKPEYAVSFLDKMYVLSTEEALDKFMKNPRPYLLPPQPRPPCKLSVIGCPFSGKTTLCNLLAQRYGAKVFDINEISKATQEEEKRKYVEKVRKQTTEIAIQQVKAKLKERMEAEALAKEEERRARLAVEATKRKLEDDDAEDSKERESDDEPRVKIEDVGDNTSDHITPIRSSETIEDIPDEVLQPLPEPMVDENHPDVLGMVSLAVADAETIDITLTPEVLAEVLENSIKEWEKDMRRNKLDGPYYGSWILDNFPNNKEQWNACVERNLLPDDIIVLGDKISGEQISKTDIINLTTERYCLKNRDWILKQMQRREKEKTMREQLARQEEERLKLMKEEQLRLEKEMEEQRLQLLMQKAAMEEAAAEREREERLGEDELLQETEQEIEEITPEAVTVKTPPEEEEEDEPESVIEETELQVLMMQPEALAFKQNLGDFDKDLSNLLTAITSTTPIEPFKVDITEQTPEKTLDVVLQHIQRMFSYNAWEFGTQDMEEEEEDQEGDSAEIENENAQEEEGEEEEDPNSKKRIMGDTKNFDPVRLKETEILVPGNPDIAAVYRERIYYFATNETKETFLEKPSEYVAQSGPLKVPPLRLFILGAKGSGKTLHGRYLAEKLGIFHISFRERLQELIIAKTKKKIGPEYVLEEENMSEEDEDASEGEGEEEEAITVPPSVAPIVSLREIEEDEEAEGDDIKVDEEDLTLTEDEEAIKAYLEANEPLSNDLLDSILKYWWTSEPF